MPQWCCPDLPMANADFVENGVEIHTNAVA